MSEPLTVGLGLSEDVPLDQQQRLARDVEAAGLTSLWTNEASGRDALLVCQAWAHATSRLEVGVGVLPIWSRSPAQIAMAAATLQEASAGRFVLGLGVSHPVTMDRWHGVTYRRPRAAASDVLAILQSAFEADRTDHDGEVFSARSLRLAIHPRPPRPRTLLAAMGPRMLDLAGAAADGVLLNWSGPIAVGHAAQRVRAAAHAAGRDGHVAAYVRIAVDPDRAAARAALAREFGNYAALPAYAAHFERQGLAAAVAVAQDVQAAGAGTDELSAAVDDEALASIGLWATPDDDLSAALQTWADAGLDHLVARVVRVGDDALVSARHALTALS